MKEKRKKFHRIQVRNLEERLGVSHLQRRSSNVERSHTIKPLLYPIFPAVYRNGAKISFDKICRVFKKFCTDAPDELDNLFDEAHKLLCVNPPQFSFLCSLPLGRHASFAVEQQLQHQRHSINAEDLSFAIIHSNQKDEDSFGAEWIHLEEDELPNQGQEQCASTFSNKDDELKCRMASHMTGGESGTNGVESVNGWQRQLAEGWTKEKSDKCLSEGASSPPAAEEVKPKKTSLRMLLERADVECN
uniref:HAT C-terminal dimerisation domain-containing protein n=1 Tax=Globodera rostochiensis TaxID=31243 RepID=A0A914H2F2_GLORO